jgi:hypothetical protein
MSALESSKKAAVSVSEMAAMCQVSRSRWYEFLETGVFPKPVRIPSMKRPAYDWQLQQKCLEIRATGIGLNGPVVFNRKRNEAGKSKPKTQPHPNEQVVDPAIDPIFEAVKSLGLTPTVQAVSDAVVALFPVGITGLDLGDVVRKVFLHLQGKRT